MFRLNVVLVQLVQALSIVGFGLLIPLVPLLAVWGLEQGFSGSPLVSWRVAADAWLLGHGVPLTVQLPEVAELEFGERAAEAFQVNLWPLGFTVFTFVLALRGGLALDRGAQAVIDDLDARIREVGGAGRPQRILPQVLGTGVVTVTLATGVLALLVALSAGHDVARPAPVVAAVVPALIVLVGNLAALAWRRREEVMGALEDWGTPLWVIELVALGLRAGGVVVAVLVALAAALFAVAFFTHFGDVVALSESGQPTLLGVVLLFLAQLALLPNAVLWTLAWMLGVPVSLGTASATSIAGTTMGPLPSIPLVGAIPAQGEAWFLAMPVVAVVTVLMCAMVLGRLWLPRVEAWWHYLVVAGVAALATALVVGGLAVAGAGAIGPGRMQQTGPDAMRLFFTLLGGAFVVVAAGLYANRGIGALRERPAGDVGRPAEAAGDDDLFLSDAEAREVELAEPVEVAEPEVDRAEQTAVVAPSSGPGADPATAVGEAATAVVAPARRADAGDVAEDATVSPAGGGSTAASAPADGETEVAAAEEPSASTGPLKPVTRMRRPEFDTGPADPIRPTDDPA